MFSDPVIFQKIEHNNISEYFLQSSEGESKIWGIGFDLMNAEGTDFLKSLTQKEEQKLSLENEES